MGRSVSTHRNAVATVFLHLDIDEDFSWDDFINDLRDNVIGPKYPSMENCNRWLGREDHIILQNCYGEISVSEYCGCVAICLAPRDDDDGWNSAWCHRAAKNFERIVTKAFKSSAMQKVATFSNGEAMYRKIV